jgi:hypothetical protein
MVVEVEVVVVGLVVERWNNCLRRDSGVEVAPGTEWANLDG